MVAGGYKFSEVGLIRQVVKKWIKHQDQSILEADRAFGLLKVEGIDGVLFKENYVRNGNACCF
jgi:hypothetical protein